VGRCWTQDHGAALLRAGGAGAGRFSGLGSSTIETAIHVGICPTRKSEEEIKQDARAVVNQPQLGRVSNRLLIARDTKGKQKSLSGGISFPNIPVETMSIQQN